MEKYPKVKSIEILENKRLKVIFDNDKIKIYDCNMILNEEPFNQLVDDVLFKNVHVDKSGYGISWNEEIDLSESELWLHSKEVSNQ